MLVRLITQFRSIFPGGLPFLRQPKQPRRLSYSLAPCVCALYPVQSIDASLIDGKLTPRPQPCTEIPQSPNPRDTTTK